MAKGAEHDEPARNRKPTRIAEGNPNKLQVVSANGVIPTLENRFGAQSMTGV